jgi:tetratricopeptide (TPR) repeat protein
MRIFVKICIGLSLISQLKAFDVQIEKINGDIRIRRGLDETWSAARLGLTLKSMDTILSGEASEVILLLEDGSRFRLGGNAILDISDLQRITERQLFLYLMSQKVENLNSPDSSASIHITNVSVVRGTQKRFEGETIRPDGNMDWIREMNGAKALFAASYFTNAIVKFYKILERYPSMNDGGEVYCYMGQSFEALKEKGRAFDAYQNALKRLNDSESDDGIKERKNQVQEALNRIKSEPAF